MMIEKADLWQKHVEGFPVVVTTNGVIKDNGEAVMGAGVALEAKRRFVMLPRDLGNYIKARGNHVAYWTLYNLFTFPTKNDWRNNSELALIEQSAIEMVGVCNRLKEPLEPGLDSYSRYRPEKFGSSGKIYMPKPGCGNGGLRWENVRLVLEKHLDDRFVVVE